MKKKTKKIELNGQFKKALDLMENTDHHIFVTGKAGTGKSTLLNYFRENTQKKIVVLAPTGVAAVNIKGQTVHSFFGFKPNVTLSKVKKVSAMYGKICKKIDAIVIDEISMVRADLLDCVDKFLRINGKKKNLPFGGVQMIFIGDLYQLTTNHFAR
ncbi:MAG: AAA family ATPase [Candidatus Pacebacteria bacterium]|nr:AAA family ATPase [Candidatus Paceibacterota bacterium]